MNESKNEKMLNKHQIPFNITQKHFVYVLEHFRERLSTALNGSMREQLGLRRYFPVLAAHGALLRKKCLPHAYQLLFGARPCDASVCALVKYFSRGANSVVSPTYPQPNELKRPFPGSLSFRGDGVRSNVRAKRVKNA